MFCKTITKHGPKMEKILTTCKTKTQEIFHYIKTHNTSKKETFQSRQREDWVKAITV